MAFGIGKKLLGWLHFSAVSTLEEICFGLGAGLGLIAYITFALGLMGLLRTWIFIIVALCLSTAAFFEIKSFLRDHEPFFLKVSLRNHSGIVYFFLSIFALAVLLNGVSTFCPEIFYDSLVYHLGAPNFFIQEGRITNVPFEVHSNLPSNMAMVYTFCLLLRDEVLARLVHFACGLLLVSSVFAFGRRFFNAKIGLIGALVFYSVPMVAMNSWAAAVDVALALFEFLALYAMIMWIQSRDESLSRQVYKGWLVASAVFCGIAMGAKYTGVFCFIMLFVLLIIELYREAKKYNRKFNARTAALFAGISILVLLPWLAKNFYFTGDPLYPYILSLTEGGGHLKAFIKVTREYFSSFKDYLVHPWALTMEGRTNASFIGPVFLVFAPLFFMFKFRNKIVTNLLVFLGGFWFLWSLATHMLRFFIPGLIVFSLLIAVYLIRADIPASFKAGAQIFLAFLCLTNLYWSFMIFYGQGGWKVVVGEKTKKEYLSQPHPGYPPPYFDVVDYINRKLPPDARVLLVGEGRSYYIKRRFLAHSVYDKNPVVEWTSRVRDAGGLYNRMFEEKITHILINYIEAKRLDDGYNIFYWDSSEEAIFKAFMRDHLREVYQYRGVYLYELIKGSK
ncbi:MAG: phospholipid carrier-dependent glycosyltransferase [bacterium]